MALFVTMMCKTVEENNPAYTKECKDKVAPFRLTRHSCNILVVQDTHHKDENRCTRVLPNKFVSPMWTHGRTRAFFFL